MEKHDILKEIRELERRLSMKRDSASYWMRTIDIVKHNIQAFVSDPYEDITINKYISYLEEAKFCYKSVCQDIHEMKMQRNLLQRKQSQL